MLEAFRKHIIGSDAQRGEKNLYMTFITYRNTNALDFDFKYNDV